MKKCDFVTLDKGLQHNVVTLLEMKECMLYGVGKWGGQIVSKKITEEATWKEKQNRVLLLFWQYLAKDKITYTNLQNIQNRLQNIFGVLQPLRNYMNNKGPT